MSNNLCTTLNIIYRISGRYEASYISEFFKMCGVLVTEQEVSDDIVAYKNLMEECDFYDHTLFLGIDNVDYEDFFDLDCKKNPGVITRFSFSNFHANLRMKNYIFLHKNLLNIASKVLMCRSKALSDLVSIYVNNDYCKYSYVQRYFGTSVLDEFKEGLSKKFLIIFNTIEKNECIAKDKVISIYSTYAKYLCAKKINDLCCSMNLNFYFRPERMIDGCMGILKVAPCFSSAYVLAASFCSCDAAFRASVLPFYKKGLKENEDSPAYVSVYYKLGQYYEKIRGEMENANEMYEKALSLSPKYFRALFKKGAAFLDDNKYLSAINTYKEIIELLDSKRQNSMLFPVEYEYLCKCYLLIGLIYDFYWSDELQGSIYYKKAISLLEHELDRSSFFSDFLDDNKGILKEYLKKRIALREHILVEKYR